MTNHEGIKSREDRRASDGIVGFAILGCLIAGVIALFKAFASQTGIDTLLCTVAAVFAFGSVVFLYFSKLL